jgi:hypothetical protein
MKDFPKEVLWYGQNEPLPVKTLLKAGDLDLTYEAGSIRNIKLGDFEAVRMIYVALRDDHWGTIIPAISEERIEVEDGSFTISYLGRYRQQGIQFDLRARVTGSNNKIVFEIDGEALSDFLTNRTGFCLLHPAKECLGKTGKVISPDGWQKPFVFPQLISPVQPVKNISEMSWPIEGGGTAEIKFEGEVFEMEDQRNWTDDSYKTYCRPLALPFPYFLKKGEHISQRITLSVFGKSPAVASENCYHLTYDVSKIIGIPEIGVRRSKQDEALSQNECSILDKVNFDFYEVQLNFSAGWEKDLQNAFDECQLLEAALKLVVRFSANYEQEITQLLPLLSENKVTLNAVLVLREQEHENIEGFIDQMCRRFKSAFPDLSIGAGNSGYFTELNSNPIKSSEVDFLSYSINPQVHAFDNQTIVENLSGQFATVRSAKAFAGKKGVHISSVTFKKQGSEESNVEGGLPKEVDPRQMSLFGAAWTLGSLKQLSEAGAEAITYFDAVGEKGIIMGDRPTRYPDEFMAEPGAVFPVYYILKEVLKDPDFELISSISSHSQIFEGLVLKSRDKKTIILANFTSEQIEVRVDGIAPDAMVKKLDEKSVIRAMYDHDRYEGSPYCDFQFDGPITTFKIRPYGLVFVNE